MSEDEPKTDVDGYEAKYMGGASALARTKMRMPWWFFALMGAVSATTLGTVVATGHLAPLFSLTLIALTTLLFSHLRMTVSPTEVHIQLGLFGPKIAMGSITRVSAEDYRPMQFGGWGIKRSRDGTWAYSVPGGRGRCVRMEYRTEKGDLRSVVVSSDEAESVVAAIEGARGAHNSDATGVRAVEGDANRAEIPSESDQMTDARKTAKG